MTHHTTTEESRFSTHTRHAALSTAVETARVRLDNNARSADYDFMVTDSWVMNVRVAADGTYFVEVAAVFAKIVLATQEANEGDMDAEREARGPEEKDYSDLDAQVGF